MPWKQILIDNLTILKQIVPSRKKQPAATMNTLVRSSTGRLFSPQHMNIRRTNAIPFKNPAGVLRTGPYLMNGVVFPTVLVSRSSQLAFGAQHHCYEELLSMMHQQQGHGTKVRHAQEKNLPYGITFATSCPNRSADFIKY